MALTITEALAEIKTVGKRIAKKREGVMPYLVRQDGVRDPLEKDGGSIAFIQGERQAIRDLGNRIVTLRRGIQVANDTTSVTVGGVTRTVSEWLIWRREVAAGEGAFLGQMRASLNTFRQQARQRGDSVVSLGAAAEKPSDFVVNFSEQSLVAEIEAQESILGALDGQLSLINATISIKE